MITWTDAIKFHLARDLAQLIWGCSIFGCLAVVALIGYAALKWSERRKP
jgi:hypothetical protein